MNSGIVDVTHNPWRFVRRMYDGDPHATPVDVFTHVDTGEVRGVFKFEGSDAWRVAVGRVQEIENDTFWITKDYVPRDDLHFDLLVAMSALR